MARPRSILGLLGVLARRRARPLAFATLLLLGLGLAAGALAPDDGPDCGLTATEWAYGDWKYDYLERLHLDPSGSGSYVLGYGQAVRVDVRFTHRVEGDELVLDDVTDRAAPSESHRTRYSVERGDWRFEEDHPYGDGRAYRYRCRLVLDDLVDVGPRTLYGSRY